MILWCVCACVCVRVCACVCVDGERLTWFQWALAVYKIPYVIQLQCFIPFAVMAENHA